MPHSDPQPREMLHQRTIQCTGYRRADGLFDVEGYLKDIKSYDIHGHDYLIKAGDALHEMRIRLTIDEDFLIHDVEAITERGPFHICGKIADDLQVLKGLRIGKGFNRKVKELLGGVKGCVHLVDLLNPMATAAFQTLFATREAKAAQNPNRDRPPIIDQCHALAGDGELVKRWWPQFYTGP